MSLGTALCVVAVRQLCILAQKAETCPTNEGRERLALLQTSGLFSVFELGIVGS